MSNNIMGAMVLLVGFCIILIAGIAAIQLQTDSADTVIGNDSEVAPERKPQMAVKVSETKEAKFKNYIKLNKKRMESFTKKKLQDATTRFNNEFKTKHTLVFEKESKDPGNPYWKLKDIDYKWLGYGQEQAEASFEEPNTAEGDSTQEDVGVDEKNRIFAITEPIINELSTGKYDIFLAEKGYDVLDLIKQLEEAKSTQEVDKIKNIICN